MNHCVKYYQQNVPQHYYLLDTIVIIIIITILTNFNEVYHLIIGSLSNHDDDGSENVI